MIPQRNHSRDRCNTLKTLMKKVLFKNQKYYVVIVMTLIIVILWNLFVLLVSDQLTPLIPISVQSIVLILVLIKSEYAKLGIKLWSLLLIVGPGLIIAGKALKILAGEPLNEVMPLISNLFMLLGGIWIYHFNSTSVEVEELEPIVETEYHVTTTVISNSFNS